MRLARLIYIFLGTNPEPLELRLAGGHRQLPARYRGCTQSPVCVMERGKLEYLAVLALEGYPFRKASLSGML